MPFRKAGVRHVGLVKAVRAQTEVNVPEDAWLLIDGSSPRASRWAVALGKRSSPGSRCCGAVAGRRASCRACGMMMMTGGTRDEMATKLPLTKGRCPAGSASRLTRKRASAPRSAAARAQGHLRQREPHRRGGGRPQRSATSRPSSASPSAAKSSPAPALVITRCGSRVQMGACRPPASGRSSPASAAGAASPTRRRSWATWRSSPRPACTIACAHPAQ